MLFLGLYIVFWILLYYLEGTHDAYITLETNEHPPAKNYYLANKYKGLWHTYDTFSYAIFHITIAALGSYVNLGELHRTAALLLLFVSVSIRIICHDLFFDLGVKRSPFTIPTCQGRWDFWDCALVWFYKTTGLNPFVFKFIPLIISTALYFFIL